MQRTQYIHNVFERSPSASQRTTESPAWSATPKLDVFVSGQRYIGSENGLIDIVYIYTRQSVK